MYRAVALTLLLFASLVVGETSLIAGRIVGGRDVGIAKHPHQVSLRHKACEKCSYEHACGGVILNEKTVITAGHCVYKRAPNSFVIVAGTDNRAGADGVVALIAKIVVHELYSPALTENDVALVFLNTPLPLNGLLMGAVKLASNQPAAGSVAIVTGWGATSEGGSNADKLQEVNVNIIDESVCRQAYGLERITSDMLCAGTVAGGRDACQYDSGGPLTSGGLLVGIVSWGSGCARPEYPGVYANVAYLKQWIDEQVQENM